MQIIPSFSHPCVISGEYYYTCVYHSMTKCFYLMNLKAILLQYSVTTLYSCSVVITNTQSSIIKREVIEYMTFDLFPIQWLFCCNSNQANSKVRHYNYLSLFCCVLQWVAGWWRVIQSELNDCSNRTAPVTLWKHHHLTLWPSGSVILSHTHTHTSTSLLKACMLTVLHKHTGTQS